jgi:transposase-like protein
VKEHQNDEDGQAFRGNGKLTPEQKEIKRLKAQVKRLEMEREILKKRRHFLQQKRSKYAFITQRKNAHPVSLLCQVLGVSRNGYY